MNVRGRNKLPCPHCGRSIIFDFGISKNDRARRSGADVGLAALETSASDDEALWAAESSEEDVLPLPPWQAATGGDLSAAPDAALEHASARDKARRARHSGPTDFPDQVDPDDLKAEMTELRRRHHVARYAQMEQLEDE